MTRPVTLIAIVGIATALICLPLAAALRHRDTYAAWSGWSGWSGWSEWSGPWSNHRHWFDDDSDDGGSTGDGGATVAREFAWSGGDRLELDLPGQLHFQPAPEWHLSIRGQARTLDRLIVEDGRIRLRHSYPGRTGPLDVQLSGPALRNVTLNGSGDLVLDGVKQDSLSVEIHGSGSAHATGSVDVLRVDIMGSGSALLAQLVVRSATIFIAGSGDADIAPSDAAHIFIAGSGNVRLHSHPRQLSSKVAGSGQVTEVPGDQGTADQSGADQTT